ncbi:TRAP transporter permease, partial [Haematobacter massiliensis]
RHPVGAAAMALSLVAVGWSLFQLWYASPLPFMLGFGVLNDTQARAIHLGFAMFLAFTAFPALARSPRDRVPLQDWLMAAVGAFCGAYLWLFYAELAARPGQPTTLDLITGILGFVLLLEATRRSLGLPMVIVSLCFVVYIFGGQYMPEVIQHRGASLAKFVNHMWLTTEGVFGVALGVSSSFVFLFVLFGTLLDKVGAGNWMMQMSIALLGHLRGGPAKVAVISSAMNGVVSGSSVSNVVSGGIFTIPLMKRTGLSGIKAGAIEASASINGQIMPPVMGAAAFLMVEYVGIPYSQVLRHAFLPAIFSYLSLLYIVHLEAVKIGAKPIPATPLPPRHRLIRFGLGISGSIVVIAALYWGINGIQALAGPAAPWLMGLAGLALYVACIAYSARHPDLAVDDPNQPILQLPLAWDVARTGLDFLIPIVVLLWCLTVEMMSPGLSAFWGTLTIIAMTATRKPLVAMFRRADPAPAAREAGRDLWQGLEAGARNMVGIAVATAVSGVVVGTMTLTGLGLMMTEFVEVISGGNVIVMLIMVAIISLIIGLGIPTTANYILVASLMAPVVVTIGSEAGMTIPLIAVHLFVFYFGIMADISPPVGLAGFAAAAISREDPIKTCNQGWVYSMRTAILPFVFIFNPAMLLMDVHSWPETIWLCFTALVAILLFAAATMNWFVTRSRWWESLALLVICFTLFRPDWWLNQIAAPYELRPAEEFMQLLEEAPAGTQFRFTVEGFDLMGDEVSKTVNLRTPEGSAAERLRANGLSVVPLGDGLSIGPVNFGSYAARIGLEPGLDVTGVLVRAEQPSPLWPTLAALAATAGIAALQLRRRREALPA